MTGLQTSTDWKGNFYNSILVIVDWVREMVDHKPVKRSVNVFKLVKIIINVIIQHHDLLNSIMTNKSLLFTSKFWLLL